MIVIREIFKDSPWLKDKWSTIIDLFQVLFLFLIIDWFKIEERSGLAMTAYFVFPAFLLANLINIKYLVHIQLALAIVIVFYAFGAFSGTILFLFFLCFFWILSAGINFNLKLFLFFSLLLLVGLLRTGSFYYPRLYLITPFVGVLFMFRGISFLHYLKNNKLKGSVLQRLNYFLLFPNLIFPFFPIIDFKEFLSGFLSKNYSDVRQKAIRYLLRGFSHLLLYRLVYNLFFIDYSTVKDLLSLCQFLFSGYLLILRLSGFLHLGMALVCLFGYDLPPVFNFYFLGNSFADLWRRINTYWRNFMQRVLFYPIYFKVKNSLGKAAIGFSAALMFIFSWIFHNYQLFWIQGEFYFSEVDGLFWLILGSVITINVVWLDHFAGRKRNSPSNHFKTYLINSIFILGCFVFMTLVWSLWSSPSVNTWIQIMGFAAIAPGNQLFLLFVFLVFIVSILVVGHYFVKIPFVSALLNLEYGKTRMFTSVSIGLLLVSISVVSSNKSLAEIIRSTRVFDAGKSERGYYKKLIDNNSGGAWEVSIFKPIPEGDLQLVVSLTKDLYLRRFIPNKSIEWKGNRISINSFGIRDKEYSPVKAKGVWRVALLGGSYEFGSGVSDGRNFESIMEKQLNDQHFCDGPIEIFNYGCGGYHLIQQVKLVKEEVNQIDPDQLFLFAHSHDTKRLSGFFADIIQSGIDLEFEFLKSIKKKSGAKQSMHEREIERRLAPYIKELISWSYREIYSECISAGVDPVLIFLPATRDAGYELERDFLLSVAKAIGYKIVDLSLVYQSVSDRIDDIVLSESDPHPNELGHQVIAEFLVRKLSEKAILDCSQKDKHE